MTQESDFELTSVSVAWSGSQLPAAQFDISCEGFFLQNFFTLVKDKAYKFKEQSGLTLVVLNNYK